MSNLNVSRQLRHRSQHLQSDSHQDNEETDAPANQRRHPKVYKRGTLETVLIDDVNCRYMCRFSIEEIYQITALLGLEENLCFKGISVSRQLGFAMLACRYSYPRRYGDMERIFPMHRQNIGKVCKGMEDMVSDKMKYGIQFNTHQFREEKLKKFAAAIDEAGALIPNVVGFIDGTLQQVSRPATDDDMQKSLYNGWKHVHALKYQSIVTPDGITSSMMGPVIGARHDKFMYTMLETEKRLQKYLHISDDEEDNYAIYGDPAYVESEHLHCPFPSQSTDPLEIECNKSMAKVRIAVEWEFAEVMKYFSYCKGYSTFAKFKVNPPTLEDYIQGMRREKIEGEDEDM
ncbi:hypothetical protein MUCCIDRAFT_82544 [Mucor lusitanicus CBS 277.49]|uniref:DDE Tnp4 domain-containing protein n=1 Tax=Mucor lusitanicus CBS 277.49 TaxID=747725 RepID=A0A162QHT4_MUCCL|nr:hypothetical protein MUCCIDRAFT_82544 [Mucor lusitanicus CBS 277.49]